MPSKIVSFTLNGRPTEIMVKPLETLQTLLREQLGYTATKAGCRQGGCGSCTVLVNGEPMLSCLLPVEDIEGQEIMTLEGLAQDGELHPLQETFFEKFAIQCGYCTPGMLLVSKALLDHNPQPSREVIVEALTGNYCRCTGYEPIIQAVLETAQRMNGHGK
ncbi:MAG TPA: (2Fe-2S)-binding protein [Anaerolineales bacterium]|nr:(2Fe-2S)-binding protein [Anaerolineales bacterium]